MYVLFVLFELTHFIFMNLFVVSFCFASFHRTLGWFLWNPDTVLHRDIHEPLSHWMDLSLRPSRYLDHAIVFSLYMSQLYINPPLPRAMNSRLYNYLTPFTVRPGAPLNILHLPRWSRPSAQHRRDLCRRNHLQPGRSRNRFVKGPEQGPLGPQDRRGLPRDQGA